jgi:hypothetical protein
VKYVTRLILNLLTVLLLFYELCETDESEQMQYSTHEGLLLVFVI